MTDRAPTRRFRSGPSRAPLVVAWLAALCLAGPVTAQHHSPSPSPDIEKGNPSPSIFQKPSGGGVSGGGIYVPPGDSGAPPGGDDNGGSGGNGGGSGSGPGGQPGSAGRGRSTPPGSQPLVGAPGKSGGTRGTSPRGGAPAPAALTGDNGVLDDWSAWWETNKFDFIELHRVQDPSSSNQGGGHETAAERETRLAGLRRMVREQILPVLRDLTASDDPAVRAAAIVSLGKLRDAESIDRALALLDDGSLPVRRSAMLALGVMTDGRAAWSLLNVASDSARGRKLLDTRSEIPVDERGMALVAASLRGDPSVAILLEELLGPSRGETSDRLLAMAADAAGLCGTSDALRSLIDIAFDDKLTQQVRSAATSALGRIGDPSVTPALVQLLDGDLEPKRAATLALGLVAHAGERKVIDRLALLLNKDSDHASRHFAAVSLGRIGGEPVRAVLLPAFDKAGSEMLPWLALALGLCQRADGGEDLAPRLLARLDKEGSVDSQAAIAVALGLTRSEQGLAPLIGLLRSKSPDIASAAATGLGLSARGPAAPPLRDLLSTTTNVLVLRDTALALGILGDGAALPQLLDLLRSNNILVASYAAIGIALVGEANAAGPLLDLIKREGTTGVATTWAVAAIGQLFDEDRRPALSRLAAGDNYLARTEPVWDLLDLGF